MIAKDDLHFRIVFVIYQTRETVFHQKSIVFYQIREGVQIADETLSQVFDISSQSKHKIRSKRRCKIVEIYAN